jgi:parvulin-like peptidyl-prolyl isomerase
VPSSSGTAAATVNGKPIPMSVYQMLFKLDSKHYQGQQGVTKQAMTQLAINQAIQNEVVAQYAAAHGITVTPAEVNQELTREQGQYGSKQQFLSQLARAGFTLQSYRFLLQGNLVERKVATKLFPIKMEKVRTAHVWHILIAPKPANPYAKSKQPRTDAQAKALATSILHQVQAGGDFAGLARQYSDDTGSAQNGGDLGNITYGQTVPPFNQAAFSAPLNHATLVKSQYGYHVLEVLSRGETEQPSKTSQTAQQQQFTKWVQNLVRKAKVKRYVS